MTRKGPTSLEWLTPDLAKEFGVAWSMLQPPRTIPIPPQPKLQPRLQAPPQIIAAWSRSARTLVPQHQRAPTVTSGPFVMRRNIEAVGAAASPGATVRSISECEENCARWASCKVFTYSKVNGMCYFYTTASFVSNAHFDSGERTATASTPGAEQPGAEAARDATPAAPKKSQERTTVPLGNEVTGTWCYDRARDDYSRSTCDAARLLKVSADSWEVMGKRCSIQESRRDGAAYMATAKCLVEGSDAPRDAENFRIILTKGKLAIRPDVDPTKGAPDGVEQWKNALVSSLERNKRFPPEAVSRGESGTARVYFELDREGNVTSVRIIHSSGSAALDEEAIDLVRRCSPFPAPPKPMTGALRITVPIRFNKKSGEPNK
jgi:TonB family protein